MMFSLADSSDRLSASAIARAAEAPTRRTSYYRSSFGVADAVCLDGRRDGAGCVRLGCAGRVVRMTGDLVAQLKGASFSYYGAPETLHAVDLDVHAGECVVLMGASGSGKTTIVRVLNGLAGGYYRGSVSGDVFLGGLSARDMEAWRRAELVGSVFQDPTAQFFSSQLAGEVAFGCENIGYPAEEVVRRTDAAIGRLGLDRLRTIAVDELSSGQKQRVAIASSLAPAPRLVVMDEPSSNLDEDAAQELGAVLMELKRQGYALVVAEHRISYLMECADRFCYMEAGRMRAVLSRDDVFAMEGSERVAMGFAALLRPRRFLEACASCRGARAGRRAGRVRRSFRRASGSRVPGGGRPGRFSRWEVCCSPMSASPWNRGRSWL